MSDPVRVLELRSVWGTGGGPEKTILLGASMSDPTRYAVTVCYIRDRRDQVYAIDSKAAELGVDYVEIVERHSFDPTIWPTLRRLVRSRGIDIVHSHDYKTDLLALALGTCEHVVPLATAHGWAGTSLRESIYYIFDRFLLTRFPVVLTVSQLIRAKLIAAGASPGRVRCLRNGIDAQRYLRTAPNRNTLRSRFGIPIDAVVVGSVGRLEFEKRFDLLIAAVGQLRSGRMIVVVAGDGSRRAALQRTAAECGLDGRVLLLGHQNDVRSVYECLDVYVQSSDTEGIPNAVLEAMALEVPIVATDVGGTRELLADGVHGLLVPRRDVSAIAAAIKRTLDDPDETGRRVALARTRVESDLSFERRMRSLEAVYDELAASCSRRPVARSSR